MGIKPGARLWWTINEGMAEVVVLPHDPIRGAVGLLKGIGPTVADLLEERRKDLEKDERKFPVEGSIAVISS
jgi:hypothetical protein